MRKKFEKFLKSINLKGYRTEYSSVKIVEMNLPKEIQAIGLLYKVYWDEKKFLDFDKFYQVYLKEKGRKIEEFRLKTGMCKKCFHKGLKARIYRTWAGLITQIHAGYVAQSVFGDGAVQMSEQLDHQDADIQVNYHGHILNYDVKKEANSGVIGRSYKPKKEIPGEKISIRYEVPNYDVITDPLKKRGVGYKAAYVSFKEKYLDTNMLEIYKNGFVVFKSTIFSTKKTEIDSSLK